MKNVLMVLFVCMCVAAAGAAELVTAEGPITSVIVYRGQALVTRSIQIPSGGGDMELLIENLPEKILPESLYAQSNGSVSVLSVRYREKAVSEDTRQQVLQLKEQIEQTQRKLYLVRRDKELHQWRWFAYDGQWKLNIDAANRDLNMGVLDVEAFKNLLGYLDQQACAVLKEQVAQETAYMDVEKQLAKLEEDLKKLSEERQKVIRQAMVYISGGRELKAKFC